MLTKILGDVHIYNFVDSVDIDEDKIDYIPHSDLSGDSIF